MLLLSRKVASIIRFGWIGRKLVYIDIFEFFLGGGGLHFGFLRLIGINHFALFSLSIARNLVTFELFWIQSSLVWYNKRLAQIIVLGFPIRIESPSAISREPLGPNGYVLSFVPDISGLILDKVVQCE